MKDTNACDALSFKINADKTVDVEITGIKADVATANELFEAIPFSGGGGAGGAGGAAPIAPEQKPTEDKNKITVEKTVNGEGTEITEIILKAQAVESKDKQSVELQLSNEQKEALIEKAAKEKSDVITIKSDNLNDSAGKNYNSVHVKMDADLVNDIVNKMKAEISVETPVGNLKFNGKALEEIHRQLGDAKQLNIKINAEEIGDYSKIIGENGYVISLEILAGKNKIKDFGAARQKSSLKSAISCWTES